MGKERGKKRWGKRERKRAGEEWGIQQQDIVGKIP